MAVQVAGSRSLLPAVVVSLSSALPVCGQINTTAIAAQVGISPAAVVIAGIDTISASTMLAQIDAADGLRFELSAQQEAAAAVTGSAAELVQLMRDDPSNPDLVGQYQIALQNLAAINAQLSSTRQLLFELAVQDLSPMSVQRLTDCRSSAMYDVPPDFRATARSVDEWRAIERALRAARRAARRAEAVAPQHAALLAAVRAEPTVMQAAFNLAANLESMTLLFDQFAN